VLHTANKADNFRKALVVTNQSGRPPSQSDPLSLGRYSRSPLLLNKLIKKSLLTRLLLLILVGSVAAAGQPAPGTENSLQDYLLDLDEMGRTLNGWQGDSTRLESWFFPADAMLLLRNNGDHDQEPFKNLQAIIPGMWQDLKSLNPRYLLELAGGSLAYGELMRINEDRPFDQLRTEEQFIKVIAGMTYLRMLETTLGPVRFGRVIHATLDTVTTAQAITAALLAQVVEQAGPALGRQFNQALSSGEWMDAVLEPVYLRSDSLDIAVSFKGSWHFPVDVLMISNTGDSSRATYMLGRQKPLRVAKVKAVRIVLDPEHKLAEYFRYNNSWPRLKEHVHWQSFFALPDWESYRITVSPTAWSDWDGDRHIGLKLSSGFGLDLWPAYPSDYRHRWSLELSTQAPYNTLGNWGSRFSWGHTLSREHRLFAQAQLHVYDDWSGGSLGLLKYVGRQRFMLQGSMLMYQRLGLNIEQDYYGDPQVWGARQRIQILKCSYSKLALTRYGDRLYLNLHAAQGTGRQGAFTLIKSQLDLSGVFWGWLAGGVSAVVGSQSSSTPAPYQFTHHYAWQNNLAALPRFRGQAVISEPPEEYLGISLSGGYWFSWFQLKLFGSSMLYGTATQGLFTTSPSHAVGFGIEHKSFFTAGLYFPVWQSHPLAGQNNWRWRYQWRLSWNL